MLISYSDIKGCCEQIKLTNGNIRTYINNIKAEKDKVQNGTIWSGPASTNYVNKLNGVLNDFENAYTSLNNYVNAMNKSVVNYEAVDKKIKEQFEDLIK